MIDVEDDGTVTIASTNREWAEAALAQVEACTATVQIGKIYDGRVDEHQGFRRVRRNPARPRRPVHISELSTGYVNSRRRRLPHRRRDEGDGDRRRRARPREAQPQAGPRRAGHSRRDGRRRACGGRRRPAAATARAAATIAAAIAAATAAADTAAATGAAAAVRGGGGRGGDAAAARWPRRTRRRWRLTAAERR